MMVSVKWYYQYGGYWHYDNVLIPEYTKSFNDYTSHLVSSSAACERCSLLLNISSLANYFII